MSDPAETDLQAIKVLILLCKNVLKISKFEKTPKTPPKP